MSATTSTKSRNIRYTVAAVRYDKPSGDLVDIQFSPSGAIEELGFKLTPENQPTATMIFTSCLPKKYEAFQKYLNMRKPIKANEVDLPPFVFRDADIHRLLTSTSVFQLVERGFIEEPE
jgi:hypothetical protein